MKWTSLADDFTPPPQPVNPTTQTGLRAHAETPNQVVLDFQLGVKKGRMPGENWARRGACHGVDDGGPLARHFFANPPDDTKPHSEPGRAERCARAVAICEGCPVLAPCQAFALRVGGDDRDSVMGGLPFNARKRVLAAFGWELKQRPRLDCHPAFQPGFWWADWRRIVRAAKTVAAQ